MSATTIRALTVPIQPVAIVSMRGKGDSAPRPCEWAEFDDLARQCWRQSAEMCNYLMSRLFAADLQNIETHQKQARERLKRFKPLPDDLVVHEFPAQDKTLGSVVWPLTGAQFNQIQVQYPHVDLNEHIPRMDQWLRQSESDNGGKSRLKAPAKMVSFIGGWMARGAFPAFDVGRAPASWAYAVLRERFPDSNSRHASSISMAVVAKYMEKRKDILQRQTMALPSYRIPQPWVLPHGKLWKDLRCEEGCYFVDLCLANQWVTVRIRGGNPMRDHLGTVQRIIGGEYEGREFQLTGQCKGGMITPMLKIVYRKPVTERVAGSAGDFIVTTGPHCLLASRLKGQRRNDEWRENADHVIRWIHAHERRLRRIKQDRTASYRAGHPDHGGTQASGKFSDKQARRMDTFLHQAAARLADRARRLNVSRVLFDDSNHQYIDQFPYYKLRGLIAQKLADRGIEFGYVPDLREMAKTRKAQDQAVAELAALQAVLDQVIEGSSSNDSDDGSG